VYIGKLVRQCKYSYPTMPRHNCTRSLLIFSSAGFFTLITVGIFVRFGVFVLDNRTSVEDVQRIHPQTFAVRIDESELPRRSQGIGADKPPPFYFLRYPFPNIYGHNRNSITRSNGASEVSQSDELYYAILSPRAPKKTWNPWNIGNMRNLKAVMGTRVWDWFIPLRYSPFLNRDNALCDFELGNDFYEMEKQFLPHRYDRQGKRKSNLSDR
jgi:hypothetical protein